MKNFSSPGFEEINSQLGMHAQPHDFDENMIHINQEVGGVNYEEYMNRVLQDQQQYSVTAPRRAPPSRPAPRVEQSQHQHSQYNGHGLDEDRGYIELSRQQYHPQQPQLHGYVPSRNLPPNPLFAGGHAASPSGGGKVMGLLERKLANRSAVNSFAQPGPNSLRRAAPSQLYGTGHANSSPPGPHQGFAPLGSNNFPVPFHDDYSEASGSFGWQGMSH